MKIQTVHFKRLLEGQWLTDIVLICDSPKTGMITHSTDDAFKRLAIMFAQIDSNLDGIYSKIIDCSANHVAPFLACLLNLSL